jgi:hypothetical protein
LLTFDRESVATTWTVDYGEYINTGYMTMCMRLRGKTIFSMFLVEYQK